MEKGINFEQELYKAFGQVKDFTLGMRIAKWFYDMGKNSKDSQEPVSEDLEEAVNAYIGYAPDIDECSSVYGKRQAFKAGYRQAEKDLELTWEDIREICRMWIESKTPFGVTGEALSIEVLKRFEDYRERKRHE